MTFPAPTRERYWSETYSPYWTFAFVCLGRSTGTYEETERCQFDGFPLESRYESAERIFGDSIIPSGESQRDLSQFEGETKWSHVWVIGADARRGSSQLVHYSNDSAIARLRNGNVVHRQ